VGTCSTTSGYTDKTPCTSVTAPEYYLDGDIVKPCAAVSGSSARTCNAGGAAGIQTVTCSSGYSESGTAGNNLKCEEVDSDGDGIPDAVECPTRTNCVDTGTLSVCVVLVFCRANDGGKCRKKKKKKKKTIKIII
jgi:hypothetical protein